MSQIRRGLFASLLCGLCAVCALSAASGACQAFTLEQVTGAPFSSELQAAPKGERWVWIANQRGHRNLFLAEARPGGGFTTRALTHFDADDGVDLGDITWTPDGASVVYARGGDFEFLNKPSPNPALIAAGVTEEIWRVPAGGGEPRKLAEGRAPAVSPDGATLAFMNGGQVYTRSLADAEAKSTQLFHTRGSLGSLLWSPDGRFLAFTSGRGDHGFVGVYSVATKSLMYLDPSTSTDDQPVWSPDSRQVAFLRHARELPAGGFKPQRTGTPWSLRVAEVSTGQGREIWRAREGQGSAFHGVATARQLLWCAGDRIVFHGKGMAGCIFTPCLQGEGLRCC